MEDHNPFTSSDVSGAVLTTTQWGVIKPLGRWVLVQPEAPKTITKKGIHLPDGVKIPTFRARVIEMSPMVDRMYDQYETPDECRLKQYDKVVLHFDKAMPENMESDDCRLLVPVENIIAKVEKEKKSGSK